MRTRTVIIAVVAAIAAVAALAACAPRTTTPQASNRAVGAVAATQQTYTVVKGDTLYSISRKFGVSVADLQAWNNMGTSTSLKVGRVLKVSAPVVTPPPPVEPPVVIGTGVGVGGVETPATALTIPPKNANGVHKITAPGVYDGRGQTFARIDLVGNDIILQNAKVFAGSQYGIYSKGERNVIRNNDIQGVRPTGDGDMNAITFFGNGTKILFNTGINFVDPNVAVGDSHTDVIQTWVSTSNPVASSDVEIRGNVFIGPANPQRLNSVPSIHQWLMVEDFNRGGNTGGSSSGMRNWLVIGNTIGDSWNQAIKNDGVDNMVITKNKFVGSSTYVMHQANGVGLQFFADNEIGPGYGRVNVPITPGAGPA